MTYHNGASYFHIPIQIIMYASPKYLYLFLCFIASLPLNAQYLTVRLMDQWKQTITQKELAFDPLTAKSAAEISTITDEGKLEYLNQSIRPIEIERYEGTAGTPFLHKNFTKGELFDASGQRIPLAPLNYNAYSGRIEFRENESWFQFLPNYFPKVSLTNDNGQAETLILGLLPGYLQYYSTLIYSGKKFKAARHLEVNVLQNEGFSGGKHADDKRFMPVATLYIFSEGKWKRSGYSTRQLAIDLGNETKLKAYLKAEKPDLKNDAELVRLLQYLEAL